VNWTKTHILSALAGILLAGERAAAQLHPAPFESGITLSASAAKRDSLSAIGTTARLSTVGTALRRAELRFQEAKRLLGEGELTAARRAFDETLALLLETPLESDDRLIAERRIEELVDLIYRYDLDNLGAAEEKDRLVFDKSPLDEIRELNFPLDPRLKGVVPEQIEKTVSQLPLEMNDTVLSFIHYFTATKVGRNTLVNGWRRSNRYRAMIDRILDEEGVPRELIFLAQAESGFLPRALSHKAAAGMWQFVRWRGQEYGLEQTPHMDLRLDPERATRAAARHLKDLYNEFGDWYLAMAAYNCGPGCVGRAVERTGYADYWELLRRRAIPRETANYVPIILAMTIVTKNAESYGLVLDDPEPPLRYETIRVETPTHVELIAGAADLPVSGIRDLNPALLKNVAPAGFDVHVPAGQAAEIVAAIESVPVPQRAASRIHRVKPGESLTEIAQIYRTTPKALLSVNGGERASLREGDMLMVPASMESPARRVAAKATPVRAKTAAGKARPSTTARKPAYRSNTKRTAR
jgi:membrane-bound lytic murein transglycosylase D